MVGDNDGACEIVGARVMVGDDVGASVVGAGGASFSQYRAAPRAGDVASRLVSTLSLVVPSKNSL